jgi:hypothetical protein
MTIICPTATSSTLRVKVSFLRTTDGTSSTVPLSCECDFGTTTCGTWPTSYYAFDNSDCSGTWSDTSSCSGTWWSDTSSCNTFKYQIAATSSAWFGSECSPRSLTPEQLRAENQRLLKPRMKRIIHDRCAPNIVVKRNPINITADIREQRARETLRRVVGEEKFLNFIKHGFVSIRAKSGLVYQIFPGHGFTNVYNKGIMVEKLCVVLRGEFPPTDSLIMRFLMILNNEEQFRSHANKMPGSNSGSRLGEVTMKSLTEIYKDLKKSA